MDYEFLRDITGVVKVRMSMDHEAIGHWFNEEVKGNLALLDEVEQAARTVKGSERSWQRAGHEYTLWLDGEEVMIRANQLEFSGDEIEEGMSYYDEESLSLCGVEDFLQVVAAYREFMLVWVCVLLPFQLQESSFRKLPDGYIIEKEPPLMFVGVP